MTCVFEAGYDITIQWFKDDVMYNDSRVYFIESDNSSTLSISSASFEDCGEYKCHAAFVTDTSVSVNTSAAYLGVVGKLS